jgi:hypothetical protein
MVTDGRASEDGLGETVAMVAVTASSRRDSRDSK